MVTSYDSSPGALLLRGKYHARCKNLITSGEPCHSDLLEYDINIRILHNNCYLLFEVRGTASQERKLIKPFQSMEEYKRYVVECNQTQRHSAPMASRRSGYEPLSAVALETKTSEVIREFKQIATAGADTAAGSKFSQK